jgi:hypothetical protein
VAAQHQRRDPPAPAELNEIENEDQRFKRLVELNVVEQVYNLHKTSIIQKAYQREANIHVHGWVYDIREGLLKDMNVDVQRTFEEYGEIYRYRMVKEEKPKEEAVKKIAIALPGDGQPDGKSDGRPESPQVRR